MCDLRKQDSAQGNKHTESNFIEYGKPITRLFLILFLWNARATKKGDANDRRDRENVGGAISLFIYETEKKTRKVDNHRRDIK